MKERIDSFKYFRGITLNEFRNRPVWIGGRIGFLVSPGVYTIERDESSILPTLEGEFGVVMAPPSRGHSR